MTLDDPVLKPRQLVALDLFLSNHQAELVSSELMVSLGTHGLIPKGTLILHIRYPCQACQDKMSRIHRDWCEHNIIGWVDDSSVPLGGYWTRSNGL